MYVDYWSSVQALNYFYNCVNFVLDFTSNDSFILNNINDFDTESSSSSSISKKKIINKKKIKDQKNKYIDGRVNLFIVLLNIILIYNVI